MSEGFQENSISVSVDDVPETGLQEEIVNQEKQESQEADSLVEDIAKSAEEDTQTPEEEVAEQAGFDVQAIAEEFDSNDGKVSDETRDALIKSLSGLKGFSEEKAAEFIDGHFSGISAQRQLAEIELYSDVGGKDGYQKLVDWAQTGMTEEERVSLDQKIEAAKGDPSDLKDVVNSLKTKYEARNGSDRRVVEGGESTNPKPSLKLIHGQKQLAKIVGSKEYKEQDTEFIAETEKRISASMKAGTL